MRLHPNSNQGIISILLCLLAMGTSTQELQHRTMAVNIEVPVRVFKGDRFIDDLALNDFEVYENGILQKIDAVYLIKKTQIEREEALPGKEALLKQLSPQTSRNFVLFFEVIDYLPKIGEAVTYFFENIIEPQDNLKVMTPEKAYNFKAAALKQMPRGKIAEQLIGKIRKDTLLACREYKNLIEEFFRIKQIEGLDPGVKLQMLKNICRMMRDRTQFDEKRVSEFADYLKEQPGQKHVFLFYQKEMMPLPPGLYELDAFDLMKAVSFDMDKIKAIFADSSITCHFVYMTLEAERDASQLTLDADQEWMNQSAEVFSAFKQIADATGGLVESSANPSFSFKKSVQASETYYLLYYTPQNYRPDGKFRNIKVKVTSGSYRVMHRAGYIAD